MSKMLFADLLIERDGLIKGPFGGDIKKSLFVPKSEDSYKVYEQGVVLKNDIYHGTYYISKKHFETKLRRFEVKKGDLLMTGAGTLGEIIAVPEDAPKGVINQALLRIRLKESVISTLFFKYYFKYYIKAIISRINGDSVIPNLPPLPIIRNTQVDIPDLIYQKKITNVLSSLDFKIEHNNWINAELEAMAKALYDYWFVQFDFPDKNGKPYKSSGGKMTWNEELKRFIPNGWDVKNLIDVTSLLVRGVSPKYIENKGIVVLNQKCIRNKSIDFSLGRRHDMESKNAESKLIYIDDVLVNSTGVGTLGRVAIVKRLEELQTTADSHVTIVRIDKEKANRFFMSYSLTEKQSEIEQLGEGSTGQTELSRDNLGRLKLLVPSNEIQKSFEDAIRPQFHKIANNEKENQKLSELRDWLLPMLMNGQVKSK